MRKGKQTISFTDALSGVAEDFDGDLAFANLETVITDRNDIAPETKGKGTFHFRSHPAAVKAMIDIGFNLFSLANNNSMTTARKASRRRLPCRRGECRKAIAMPASAPLR
jgi:poly-gamma-glutamate synthesis protein (capsule biosynthesis protein)